MKKILIIFTMLIASVGVIKAQQGRMGGTPQERAQRQADRLATDLKLTADQKTKVYDILLSQSKSQDSLRSAAGQNADFQTLRPKFMEIQEAGNKKISALLNDEQKKTFDTYLEERRNRMQGGGNNNGGGNRQRRNQN